MRALIQRVTSAEVQVDSETVGAIGAGLLVFAAVHRDDTSADAAWMTRKLLSVRVFEDDAGKMGRSVEDVRGALLIVSQFTLYGDLKKGNRPDFGSSMGGPQAREFLSNWVAELRAATQLQIQEGRFGAHMKVSLINDGPVTLLLDSRMP